VKRAATAVIADIDQTSTALVAWWRGKGTPRIIGLCIYYAAVILGLILLYGKGDFSTPGFIYQGF
jgi:hypothetical protein